MSRVSFLGPRRRLGCVFFPFSSFSFEFPRHRGDSFAHLLREPSRVPLLRERRLQPPHGVFRGAYLVSKRLSLRLRRGFEMGEFGGELGAFRLGDGCFGLRGRHLGLGAFHLFGGGVGAFVFEGLAQCIDLFPRGLFLLQ